MNHKINPVESLKNTPLTSFEMETLLSLIKSVKFGSVTLVIQDGKVVQIDKNEKVRLR